MKTVFFDIDGTLVDFPRGLKAPSAKTRYAFEQLKKNNHRAIIASGRVKGMLPKEIVELNPSGFLLGNGSYLEIDGRELFSDEIPEEYISRVIEYCKNNEGIYYVETEDKLFTNGINNPYHEQLIRDFEDETSYADISLRDDSKVNMMGAIFKDDEAGLRFFETFKDVLDLRQQFFGMPYYDINALVSNKGNAIRKYINLEGLTKEDCFAFGDSYNDLEMMGEVKYSIAMGNAIDDVKKLAYDITEDVLDEGVYNALVRYSLIDKTEDA